MQNLTISIIQSQLHWENEAENLNMFAQKINSITEPTELIILPEMFSTGFSMNPKKFATTTNGKVIRWMQKTAQQKKVVLTGSVMFEENKQYYNRLIWMLPTGDYGYYNKRHLFAYAQEHQHYTPGTKRLIAQVKGWKILLLICYDLRFPVWSRQQSFQSGTPEFDAIIYVANWPERRNTAWKTLLQARAIENQCYVIGVNRVGEDGNGVYHSGDSCIINPLGDVLFTKAHDEAIFTTTLDKTFLEEIRTKLPFWKDGDNFSILS